MTSYILCRLLTCGSSPKTKNTSGASSTDPTDLSADAPPASCPWWDRCSRLSWARPWDTKAARLQLERPDLVFGCVRKTLVAKKKHVSSKKLLKKNQKNHPNPWTRPSPSMSKWILLDYPKRWGHKNQTESGTTQAAPISPAELSKRFRALPKSSNHQLWCWKIGRSWRKISVCESPVRVSTFLLKHLLCVSRRILIFYRHMYNHLQQYMDGGVLFCTKLYR